MASIAHGAVKFAAASPSPRVRLDHAALVPERDAACAIAQAAAVVGDWWSLLLIRETARGHLRFVALQRGLGISRKVLAERIAHLVDAEVLEKVPYQSGPVRFEYRLTDTGCGLLPVLLSMQDWADRWVFGDGSLSGTADEESEQARRVAALTGERLPHLELPSHRDGEPLDPVAPGVAGGQQMRGLAQGGVGDRFIQAGTNVPGAQQDPIGSLSGEKAQAVLTDPLEALQRALRRLVEVPAVHGGLNLLSHDQSGGSSSGGAKCCDGSPAALGGFPLHWNTPAGGSLDHSGQQHLVPHDAQARER